MKSPTISIVSLVLGIASLACNGSAKKTEPAAHEAKSAPASEPKTANEAKAPANEANAEPVAPSQRVNLNTTPEDDFKKIPNVGDKMAHEFDEYRPYASITQFRKEIGKYVDEQTIAGYEKYVFVPIAFNDCDAATIQQIPGIDADTAQKLIAGRPYADADAFLAKVGELGGEPSKAAATTLLAGQAE